MHRETKLNLNEPIAQSKNNNKKCSNFLSIQMHRMVSKY